MKFEILGEIHHVETIASGPGIRILDRLVRLYGKGNWRKVKGGNLPSRRWYDF